MFVVFKVDDHPASVPDKPIRRYERCAKKAIAWALRGNKPHCDVAKKE